MVAEIKDDFEASFLVMARTAETSLVAKRSMPILLRLKERIECASNDPQQVSSMLGT
jgi:hypothetical protein